MIQVIVLDIEGTTTPIAFVHDVLFTYARQHLRAFLVEHRESPQVRAAAASLEEERAHDDTPASATESLASYIEWLMERDRKSPGLKVMQGLIWERGYRGGTLRGEVYDDVRPALERWRGAGIGIAIYSSGSEHAQRLLFAHSTAGDLTPYIDRYFDTRVGAKRMRESYERIAAELQRPASDVLFVSDIAEELVAARDAGLRTVLCDRLAERSTDDVIRSFDDITMD